MAADDCVLGIDIGGTTTSLGIVSKDGTLHGEKTIATQAQRPAAELVARIADACSELHATLTPSYRIAAIGIGAPNANYHRGTVENPPNLAWGASTNLIELFQKHMPLPVAVTNDANAAALGELLFGGAQGMQHIIAITLGTGLGSGIIVNGGLLYGADGFAGELGHTTVDPAGRECACGKRGCLETYVSAPGLCRTLLELLAQHRADSPLRSFPVDQLTARDIFAAACSGDTIALAAFDTTARLLGQKLADAVAHTSPEAIFISGGLAAAGELLIAPTKRYMEEFLFPVYKGRVTVQATSLPEGAGALLGAAALAWHELRKTV